MTPLQIDILMHYHCRAVDYPDLSPPAQREAIKYFLENKFLQAEMPGERTMYAPTEKLHVYCEALCNVPEPRQIWVCD